MRLLIILTTTLFGLALFGAAASDLQAAKEKGSPADAVLERHLQAFAKHDVAAIMADYAEDAVFITPQGVLKGKDEIRPLFEGLVKEFSSPKAKLTIHKRHAAGPVAYITWSAETPSNSYSLATDTLYVTNDLIQYQTFAAHLAPK